MYHSIHPLPCCFSCLPKQFCLSLALLFFAFTKESALRSSCHLLYCNLSPNFLPINSHSPSLYIHHIPLLPLRTNYSLLVSSPAENGRAIPFCAFPLVSLLPLLPYNFCSNTSTASSNSRPHQHHQSPRESRPIHHLH